MKMSEQITIPCNINILNCFYYLPKLYGLQPIYIMDCSRGYSPTLDEVCNFFPKTSHDTEDIQAFYESLKFLATDMNNYIQNNPVQQMRISLYYTDKKLLRMQLLDILFEEYCNGDLYDIFCRNEKCHVIEQYDDNQQLCSIIIQSPTHGQSIREMPCELNRYKHLKRLYQISQKYNLHRQTLVF